MGLRKKNFIARFLKHFIQFLVFIVLSLVYCEYLHYFVVLSNCYWPNLKKLPEDSNQLHIITLADTHLLGKRNGHWFDKLRREWQMYRSFQTTMNLHGADVVIFLGDLFDEGKWCGKEEFENYVERFNSLFYVNPSTKIIVTAGNHDMGFHYSINSYLYKRFKNSFNSSAVSLIDLEEIMLVTVNSMAMHGDDCFLCKPARLEIEKISKKLKCMQGFDNDFCSQEKLNYQYNYSEPILIQHYPLYRESDEKCSEPDEAPKEEKKIMYREKWECLSKESSDLLLRELQPRLVLSGHTHHGCQMRHNITDFSKSSTKNIHSGRTVLESTVSSFSWRNKNNPAFLMITVSKNDYSIYKCHMPKENTVYTLYIIFSFLYFIYLIRKKCRMTNFFYNKYYKES